MSILYIGNFLGKLPGFYAGPNQWIVESLQTKGYDVKYASDALNKPARLLDILYLIISQRNKSPIAFIDTFSTQAFYFAFLASWMCYQCKIKYILILHGGDLPHRFAKSKILVNRMFKHAHQIVSPSAFLQQKSVEANLPKPMIIPNPIDIGKYTYKQRSELKPNLIWVRSLQTVYNPSMAILVVEKLKEKYQDVKLTMVGPDKENLMSTFHKIIREKKLENNIQFTGKLSLNEWLKLSESHDIFINTTHIDNTPVSVLEAMALGLPVVSTNVGGIPYIVKDQETSMLCGDNDKEGMVQAIETLLMDRKLVTNLTKKARMEIEDKYNAPKILNQWISLVLQEQNKYI